MANYRSQRRSNRNQSPPPATETLVESVLTIPDALIEWACETDRAMGWPRPWGQEVAGIVLEAQATPLPPSKLEALLSRLDAIVGAAVREGRSDLLTGFDLLTAEWLGLHIHAETVRGPLHIGPRPRMSRLEHPVEPGWTYDEVRAVTAAVKDHESMEPMDAAWRAKELLAEAFDHARVDLVMRDLPDAICPACGKPEGPVMVEVEGGAQYHAACWSEMIAPTPEHVKEILRKAPKAMTR